MWMTVSLLIAAGVIGSNPWSDGFEAGLDDWQVKAGAANLAIVVDEREDAGRFLAVEHGDRSDFFMIDRVIPARRWRDQPIQLSAMIRTDGVESGFAGLSLDALDEEGELLFRVHTEDHVPPSAPNWTPIRAAMIVPADAASLRMRLAGDFNGTVQFDDVALACLDPLPEPTPAIAEYLKGALDLMQSEALDPQRIDWRKLLGEVRALARGAESLAETYPAIRYAVAALGDGHSDFYTPRAMRVLNEQDGDGAPVPMPSGHRIGSDIGFLRVPAFRSGNPDASVAYAARLHELMASMADACGFVVDLRGNSGGSVWPMLLGVGPLAGRGVLAGFIGSEGRMAMWSYRNGKVAQDVSVRLELPVEPFEFGRRQPPVALLIDGDTGSAGEMTAIAFNGRPGVRRFGQPTAGMSTVNANYQLADGARLILTVGELMDRDGRVQKGPIVPDELVKDDSLVLDAATQWLRRQPACRD